MDKMIHKCHRLTTYQRSSFRENIRIMEPISFRGSNRIVAILVSEDRNKTYFNDITILYLAPDAEAAINMFIKDWKERVGENFIVKDKSGRIFYDNPQKFTSAESVIPNGLHKTAVLANSITTSRAYGNKFSLNLISIFSAPN